MTILQSIINPYKIPIQMDELITSRQEQELKRMLNDQMVSIKNIEVNEAKEVKPYQHGTVRQTKTFNEWIELIFKNR